MIAPEAPVGRHADCRFAANPPPILLGLIAGVAACSPWLGAPLFVLALLAAAVLWYAVSVEHGWVGMFLAAALLLPPLPLAWGDSGPHVAVVFAAAGLLALLLRSTESRLAWTGLHAAMFLYLAAIAFSAGFSVLYSGPVVAANSAVRAILFALSFLVYYDTQQGRASDGALRFLYPAAVTAAAVACVDFWFQLPAPAGYGPQFIWLESGVYRRAQGFFYESSTLGTLCAFSLVMIVVSFVARPALRRHPGRIALLAGSVLFGLALLLSYSRGTAITVAAAVVILAWIERRRWLNARVLFGAVVCGAAVLIVLVVAFPEFAQGYLARIQFTMENAWSRPDRVLSGRIEGWRTLAAFVGDHPWQTLFGIGYKTLPYTEHLGKPVVADNAYLSALVETGLAGFCALIALNAAILGAVWRAARKPGSFYAKWIFCFWAGFTLQMLSGDVLTYWRVLPVFFWALGVAVREDELAASHSGSIR